MVPDKIADLALECTGVKLNEGDVFCFLMALGAVNDLPAQVGSKAVDFRRPVVQQAGGGDDQGRGLQPPLSVFQA